MAGMVAKLLRYAGVSVISTAVSMTILGILVASNAVTAGWANLIATAVGTVPSFELNRRWVWHTSGRRSAMVPFAALSFLGLGLSTIAVSVVSGLVTSALRTVAAEAANVGTFGSLWLVQYVLLDRVLFRDRHQQPIIAMQ